MWSAIEHYAQLGFKELSLGKTSLNNEGLRHYKLGWGAEEKPLMYYQYNVKERCFETDRGQWLSAHQKWLPYLPMPILRGVGKMMYRHVG